MENITRSQSEFEVKTSRLHEEQENESYQAAIGFSIECDWLGKSFIDQSNDEIKRSQSNPGLFSALNLKFFLNLKATERLSGVTFGLIC